MEFLRSKNEMKFELYELPIIQAPPSPDLYHLNGMDHAEEHIEKGSSPKCEMLVLQENILEKLKDEIIIK